MKKALFFCWLPLLALAATARGQTNIEPQVRMKAAADAKIAVVEIAPHFVTTIRAPEPVNAVVVGDPALFQVEHSEHEPELVFVKALTTETAQSNLLISTTKGRQISFVLVSHARGASPAKVLNHIRNVPVWPR
jgi:type IV secretory pathway VirB9-like protein